VVALGACGGRDFTVPKTFPIASPPPTIQGHASQLRVPTSCPVYAPGGGDVDTPESPFPAEFTIVCGVDSEGGTYGVVNGDAPTARLAVLPGNREVGLYIGFSADHPARVDKITTEGPDATVETWVAPANVESRTSDCCAEAFPNARRDGTIVALGQQGMLVSLGQFDGTAEQAVVALDFTTLYPNTYPWGASYISRFYVGGVP
jgi:hypothetical protein